MDGIDIRHLKQFGQGRLTRQGQDFRLERRIEFGIFQNGGKGCQQGLGELNPLSMLHPGYPVDNCLVDQHLRRIPAGKFIAGMTHQEGQRFIAVIKMQLDRCGEVPQQGGYRFDRHLIEHEGLL